MPEPDEVTMDTEDIPSSTLSIGFIGAGVMASALVDGLVQKSVVDSPSRISCSDPWPKALDVARSKGINVCKSNEAVCEQASDVIILAVKPDVIPLVCADIMKVRSDALVISIAAGITISQLENDLPGRRIVRVMPNTPSLVGEAACGYAIGRGVTDLDKTIVETIFGAVGIALQVEEKLMAAITGLSGSGPAYVYLFIEALSDGGVRAGLPRNVATQLAAQTVKGAAEMVLKTGRHTGQLKDGVTSAGGTTIAGVEALERGAFRGTTMSAVMAATKRCMQLANASEQEIDKKLGPFGP